MGELLSLNWVLELPVGKQIALLRKANTNGRDTFLLLVRVYVSQPERAPKEVLNFISAESKKVVLI